MDNVVVSMDFIFNSSSSAKSSSNGDIMALLQGGGYRESRLIAYNNKRILKQKYHKYTVKLLLRLWLINII